MKKKVLDPEDGAHDRHGGPEPPSQGAEEEPPEEQLLDDRRQEDDQDREREQPPCPLVEAVDPVPSVGDEFGKVPRERSGRIDRQQLQAG